MLSTGSGARAPGIKSVSQLLGCVMWSRFLHFSVLWCYRVYISVSCYDEFVMDLNIYEHIALKAIIIYYLKKYFTYVFLERGEGREKERKRTNVWLPLACPSLGVPGLRPRPVP